MKRTALASAAAVAALLLTACSASANLTVSPEKIAEEAEGALEAQIGSRPDIDCGEENVDLVDGTVVDCLLTDPETMSQFDTTVTLSEVDGTNFKIDVQVASEPNAA
ncbi:hypothetical protein C8046_09005 [Serinibacter arcticus]|uniref:DUF4333 domain-containing protein n=1 Tax=Serinibacter arcticus TaxID=1655435 RepID=A0A2U1ZV19_9MICO|nr:hypothetical protein [Serinibacter arcticus]PWD50762.1 hypothetical protein C8046_09005 [Serinibacter arcticus]